MHFPEQEIAEGVGSEELCHAHRIHDVAKALAHLGVAHKPVAMHIEVLVHGQAGRLEHGGPEDAVGLEDILGNQVLCRPVVCKVLPVGPAQDAHVVDQGIKPHIGDVVLVKGQLYAPGKTALGT